MTPQKWGNIEYRSTFNKTFGPNQWKTWEKLGFFGTRKLFKEVLKTGETPLCCKLRVSFKWWSLSFGKWENPIPVPTSLKGIFQNFTQGSNSKIVSSPPNSSIPKNISLPIKFQRPIFLRETFSKPFWPQPQVGKRNPLNSLKPFPNSPFQNTSLLLTIPGFPVSNSFFPLTPFRNSLFKLAPKIFLQLEIPRFTLVLLTPSVLGHPPICNISIPTRLLLSGSVTPLLEVFGYP